ncbi:hypothetical protein T05_12276 [Trichinella murrelli]|uniref:Uncharacterized protein n=1 Tax=Trichinella murrelli TaxID=144512 RepID=A0A0V0SQL4_9BILA|nr:hypothetical protein T05_12276 [Trichinella murrelli]
MALTIPSPGIFLKGYSQQLLHLCQNRHYSPISYNGCHLLCHLLLIHQT